MFDPITFPMLIPPAPLVLAKILTISSGMLVPKATIVKPIIISEIPNRLAIVVEPSTKISAPLISKINPMKNKINIIVKVYHRLDSSWVHSE